MKRSVRKRTWTTKKGVAKHSFVLDYVDGKGKRHIETYRTEREANARRIAVGAAVKQGTHTAHSESITVAKPAKFGWRTAEQHRLNAAPWLNTSKC